MRANEVLVLWAAFFTMTFLKAEMLIHDQVLFYAYLGVHVLFMLTVSGMAEREPVQWLRSFWIYACVITIMCMHNFEGLLLYWAALIVLWGLVLFAMSRQL